MSDLDALLGSADSMSRDVVSVTPYYMYREGKLIPQLIRYQSFMNMYKDKKNYSFTSLITELTLAVFDIGMMRSWSKGFSYVRTSPFKDVCSNLWMPPMPEYLVNSADFILSKYNHWEGEFSLMAEWDVLDECAEYLYKIAHDSTWYH